MAIVIQWYAPDDATPLTALALAGIGGVPSSPQTAHLWNQKGGSTASAAKGGRALALVRDPGETLPVASGRAPVDERWIEARIIGGLGGAIVAATTWMPLGNAAWLALPDLSAGTGVEIEVRVSAPLYVDFDVLVLVSFALDFSAYWPIGIGLSQTGHDGVIAGLGDAGYSAVILAENAAPTETPGASVDFPYIAWIGEGLPYAVAAHAVTPDATDGASASLSSGEGYWTAYSLAAGGTITATKGLKDASSAAVKPAMPAGEPPYAYVLRDSTAVIHSSAIINAWTLERFALSSNGLTVTIGPGMALQNSSFVPLVVTHPLPVAASATNYIWLDRGLQVSTAAPAASLRPLVLWEVDTDGAGVTVVRDRRRFVGAPAGRRALRFGATLAGSNNSSYEVVDALEPLLLDPERPLVLALDTLGSGNTSGVHRVDVQVLADDGTPSSIFPDTASMPQMPYNSTAPVTRACAPTTLIIPAGKRVRAHVDAVPSGGTAAAGATVALGA